MYVTIRGLPSGDIVPVALTFPCVQCGAKPKHGCVESDEPISPKARYHGKRVCRWRFEAAVSSLRTLAAYAVERELARHAGRDAEAPAAPPGVDVEPEPMSADEWDEYCARWR